MATKTRGPYIRVRQLPEGTCRECGDPFKLRLDGTLRYHAASAGHCRGSRRPPVEGVLMDCLWCSRLFISEDEGHRFCSETCAGGWEAQDGTWDGWDIDGWLMERTEREEDL